MGEERHEGKQDKIDNFCTVLVWNILVQSGWLDSRVNIAHSLNIHETFIKQILHDIQSMFNISKLDSSRHRIVIIQQNAPCQHWYPGFSFIHSQRLLSLT